MAIIIKLVVSFLLPRILTYNLSKEDVKIATIINKYTNILKKIYMHELKNYLAFFL